MSREDSRFRVQTLRSSFTKQALSGMRSSASFGFGTATRDSFSRMYTSQAADKSNVRSRGGNNSSGPAYSPNLSSFGKQNVSVARTATTTMFGTEERGRRCVSNGIFPLLQDPCSNVCDHILLEAG